MREKLKPLCGKRFTFQGMFGRYGVKKGWHCLEGTLLLTDIKLGGEQVADHIWLNYSKRFADLGQFETGDILEFDARVDAYMKGYHGHREDVYKPESLDYRLIYPSKAKLLNREVKRSITITKTEEPVLQDNQKLPRFSATLNDHKPSLYQAGDSVICTFERHSYRGQEGIVTEALHCFWVKVRFEDNQELLLSDRKLARSSQQ